MPSPHDPATAQALWRSLVEQIPAITYIADFDERSTLTWVSPQIETLLGQPPAQLLAEQDLWYELIHPEDVERVKAEEQRVYEAGEEFDVEYRMVSRDGRVIWVRERDSIVRDDDGAPRFTQGVLYDITHQRRVEVALRAERDRAQSYLDIAGTFVILVDTDDRI